MAGIAAAQMGARNVVFQELESVALHTQECCDLNKIGRSSIVGKRWGSDCVEALLHSNDEDPFSLIIMADVLYHCEDFTELFNTLCGCSKINSEIIR